MDCPTCGKSLATERGMRQHHTKVHGDPLPNRTCKGCGISREEIGHEPDVHHLTPVREFDDPQLAHTLANVICLCRSCRRYAELELIDGLSPVEQE